MLLLRTISGSRLYGLSHAKSDYDYWEVYSNKLPSPAKYIKQTISGDLDLTQSNLSTFMRNANKCTPQALECMFSEQAEIDEITELRRNYRLDTAKFYHVYLSLIHMNSDTSKKNAARHSLRLALNLKQGMKYARFCPTLTDKQIERIVNSSEQELFEWRDKVINNL